MTGPFKTSKHNVDSLQTFGSLSTEYIFPPPHNPRTRFPVQLITTILQLSSVSHKHT